MDVKQKRNGIELHADSTVFVCNSVKSFAVLLIDVHLTGSTPRSYNREIKHLIEIKYLIYKYKPLY